MFSTKKPPIYKILYFQVVVAVVVGVLLGHFYPSLGVDMKPFGDAFIKGIKMLIAPIIFCTVVLGIAGMEDMKKVGKTGGLALLYFEIVSTIALLVGLVVVNVLQPGAGMNIDPASLDTKGIAAYTGPGKMGRTDVQRQVFYGSQRNCYGVCNYTVIWQTNDLPIACHGSPQQGNY